MQAWSRVCEEIFNSSIRGRYGPKQYKNTLPCSGKWKWKDSQNLIFYIFRSNYNRAEVCIYQLSDFLLSIFAGVAAERNTAQKLLLQWAMPQRNNANRLCLTFLQLLPSTMNHREPLQRNASSLGPSVTRHPAFSKQSSELLIDFMQNSSNHLVSEPELRHPYQDVISVPRLVIQKENRYIYKHWVNIDEPDIPGASKVTPQNQIKHKKRDKCLRSSLFRQGERMTAVTFPEGSIHTSWERKGEGPG